MINGAPLIARFVLFVLGKVLGLLAGLFLGSGIICEIILRVCVHVKDCLCDSLLPGGRSARLRLELWREFAFVLSQSAHKEPVRMM